MKAIAFILAIPLALIFCALILFARLWGNNQ